jgi:hypothetical protein
VCDSEGKSEITQSLLTIGQIAGAISFLPLADRYGRKTIYVIIGIFMFFATTLISLSPNYYVYAVMKFISGATTEVCILSKEIEDTKGVIRIRISKKNRQHNGQKKKDKQRSTKHTHKTKDRSTRT